MKISSNKLTQHKLFSKKETHSIFKSGTQSDSLRALTLSLKLNKLQILWWWIKCIEGFIFNVLASAAQWPHFYLKSPYHFSQYVPFCCLLYLVLSLLYFSLLLSVSCYLVFSSCSLTLSIFHYNTDSLSPPAPRFISLTLTLSCCSVKINFNIY